MTDPVPAPRRPVADLGPGDSYAPVADLDTALGGGGYALALPNYQLRQMCLILATRWVAYRVGAIVTDLPLDPGAEPAPAFQVVPAPPAWRQATVVAAVRFYKSPEVPFGVAGGWDMATYVRTVIPDADLLLYGQRSGWGIA